MKGVIHRGDTSAAIDVTDNDLYIWELFDLDTTSESAIVGFVRRWGPGATWESEYAPPDLPSSPSPSTGRPLARRCSWPSTITSSRSNRAEDENASRTAQRLADDAAEPLNEEGDVLAVGVEKVRFGVHRTRDAVRVLVAQLTRRDAPYRGTRCYASGSSPTFRRRRGQRRSTGRQELMEILLGAFRPACRPDGARQGRQTLRARGLRAAVRDPAVQRPGVWRPLQGLPQVRKALRQAARTGVHGVAAPRFQRRLLL